jgi:hypothetical protein
MINCTCTPRKYIVFNDGKHYSLKITDEPIVAGCGLFSRYIHVCEWKEKKYGKKGRRKRKTKENR